MTFKKLVSIQINWDFSQRNEYMCMLTIHIALGDPDYSFYPIIIKTSSDNPSAQPQDTPSPDGTLSTVS